jgi:hypothetical protein
MLLLSRPNPLELVLSLRVVRPGCWEVSEETMRPLACLKVVGIALGFISGTHAPGSASTFHPNSEKASEARQDNDYLMRSIHSEDAHSPFLTSGSTLREVPKDNTIATLLLDRVQDHSDQGGRTGASILSERFDANDGPTQKVSATPLPAALPLFAGGLGILGYLGRRRKRNELARARDVSPAGESR